MQAKGFYFITDPSYTREGVLRDIHVALDCGIEIVQYRDKTKTTLERFIEAEKASALCKNYGASFIVNDSVEIAHAVEADGVNVGRNDLPLRYARRILGPDRIIGVSVSSMAEVRDAIAEGASYLGAGPIEKTPTKLDAAAPTGLEFIENIAKITDIPIAAIGGVDFDNAVDVLEAGAVLICAISAVYKCDTLKKGIDKIKKICERYIK
jgi:thiamine-phosphate pyrophosphorylase